MHQNNARSRLFCKIAKRSIASTLANAIIDNLLTLVEPPRVIKCIETGILNIDYFELKEGETLSSTCIVSGDPKPFLQCYLLNKFGKVDNRQITSKKRRNFTDEDWKRLEFHLIRRTVTKVECEIDGDYTPKTKIWRNMVVDCEYSFLSNSILKRLYGNGKAQLRQFLFMETFTILKKTSEI